MPTPYAPNSHKARMAARHAVADSIRLHAELREADTQVLWAYAAAREAGTPEARERHMAAAKAWEERREAIRDEIRANEEAWA